MVTPTPTSGPEPHVHGATDGLDGGDEYLTSTELTSLDLTYGRIGAALDVVRTVALVVIAIALVVIA